jgi:hypothetical protein
VELVSLHGRLFFDYNGNGVHDGKEPAVAGALVQLTDDAGKVVVESLTDSSGDYRLEDLKFGIYKLHVQADRTFRYLCRSPDDVAPISRSYDFVSYGHGATEIDIGLMEGFLTLPLSSETEYSIGEKTGGFYDWDPRLDHVEWWDGRSFPYHNKQGVGGRDDHTGIDFDASEGAQVVAPAPGTILSAGIGPNPESLAIDIQHDLGFKTSYNHLSKTLVSAGQRVSRGQTMGLVGSTGTFYPHLHFEIYQRWSDGVAIFDPYRPTFPVAEDISGCWALKGREKYWLHLSPNQNPNLLNYWTKDNDPQYPSA